MDKKLKIFIGADHRGYELKNQIRDLLIKEGHKVMDTGTYEKDVPCDYPKMSCEVGVNVAKTAGSRGILVCMTGIGHSIAANKIPGVYAALCYNQEAAALSRQHNNSNVLVLGAKFVDYNDMLAIIRIWLTEPFEGGRHLVRIKQIKDIEKKFMKPRK